MSRNFYWKLILVVFVIGWAILELYPLTSRNIGEVFQERAVKRNDVYTNIVTKFKELEKVAPRRNFGNLMEAVGTNDITSFFPFDTKNQPNPTRYVLDRLQREAAGSIRLGLDLRGGSSFLVGVDTTELEKNTNNAVLVDAEKQKVISQAVEVLRKRVDRFGVAEPLIQPMGDNRILIQVPGLSDADLEDVRENIQKAAFLEFRMVHERSAELLRDGIVPPGYEIKKETRTLPNGQTSVSPYLVRKTRVGNLSGKNIATANVTLGTFNEPEVSIRFDGEGAVAFAEITRQSVGKQMAILLDGELYSAPVIKGVITGGSCTISGGGMSDKDARQLAGVLENPLDAPLMIVEERAVDPSLGKDTIQSGIRSAIWGTIAVVVFMLIYYMFAGFVANVALLSNVVISLGVMAYFETTLTLPGIAGIVLTVGMAVDANVLIFERIREELAKGKSLRGALAAGYDRAFGTIFDSHVTTLISSVILMYMGTGAVKGFGVTLTIGVAASLFTALVITRLIFDFALAKGWLKSLKMLHIIKPTKIDFMKYAKPAFALSWIIILLGIGYGIFGRGKEMLGVDFAGGDSLVLSFDKKVDQEEISKAITKAGIAEPLVQYQKEITGGTERLRITTTFGTGEKVTELLKKEFPEAGLVQVGLDKVGATIGEEIRTTAIWACLLSLIGILLYVAFRYEFSFAFAAVFAVVHDVLMTIGCYCLAGLQFNAPTVAAILTIIGFSINDTIVIFDRIREDLKMGVRGSFKELINHALNQTLSRTIITSGTVLLATLSLYLFGGGAIHDFAFTFLVGIITGTYSSIFIASAIVLWWHRGERPKASSQVVMENTATTTPA